MPSLTFLRSSERTWKSKHARYRERYHAALKRGDQEYAAKMKVLADKASDNLARRREQLAALDPPAPRIITAAQLGLEFQYLWGGKGDVIHGTGHYTAGRKVTDAAGLIAEARADHAYHASKGWGGLSYESMVYADTIVFGNPMGRKSAAVAAYNTGMVSVCVPGTTGDQIDPETEKTLEWLMANWHTSKVPAAHRLPKPASQIEWRGHHDWPGQSTACPGDYLQTYRRVFP